MCIDCNVMLLSIREKDNLAAAAIHFLQDQPTSEETGVGDGEASGNDSNIAPSDAESFSSVTSVVGGMPDIVRRAEVRKSSTYDKDLLGLPPRKCIKGTCGVGSFILCSIGQQERMVMEVTEVDDENELLCGIYYEEKLPRQEDGKRRFVKRDERDPTEVSWADFVRHLCPPEQEGRGRKLRYIFYDYQKPPPPPSSSSDE